MKNDNTNAIDRRRFLKDSAKVAAAVTITGTIPTVFSGCDRGRDNKFDVVVKGGLIYDGTLSQPFVADIGINGDKIAHIGDINDAAGKEISARGLTITPGFIDVHTHCDLTFKRLGLKRFGAYIMPSWKGNHNYLYQGVTTVVTGNCGYGYPDIDDWFDIADGVGFGSNVYHLTPHGMLRYELFGTNQPRELSRRQLSALKDRVSEEMQKGSAGLSTGLEYAPGVLASTDELIELCKVVRRYNRPYVTHVRSERGTLDRNGVTAVEKAIREAIDIGRRAEIQVELSHLKIFAPINNKKANLILDIIEEARAEGLAVTADQYPYLAGSTFITILLPPQLRTTNGVKPEYRTKEGRGEVRKAIENVFGYLGPDKILVTMYPGNTSHEGRTLSEIAAIKGKPPADMYVEMACEDQPPIGVFFGQDMDIVRDIMVKDYIITASDGWTVPKDMTNPHPRVYGTFPRKIRKFVFEEKRLDLIKTIRSMTSLPAKTYHLQKRGEIAVGNYADLAVINLDNLADQATYRNPHQYSEGIEHLLINGELCIEAGIATGNRSGRSIRMV